MRTPTTALGVLTAALVTAVVTPRALAQEAPPANASPASPDATTPSTPATAPAGQQGAAKPMTAAGSGISEDAKRHFAAGVTLLQDPEGEKVEEAYREFRTAYDISNSPKILGNMGFCAMRLERDGEAIDAYSRYLREVPDIDPDERAQIVRDLQTLTVGVARITIEADKPGVRILDVRIPVRGDRITNAYGPVEGKLVVGIRPGHHVITAKLPDHEDEVWELDAYAASRDSHTFTMRERAVAVAPPVMPAESGGTTNIGPYIMMGIGGAMLVGGAITGIVALGKTSDIEAKCPNDVCPRSFDLDDARSSAKTFVRITDVLLIGGALVGVGGAAWLLFGSSGSSDAEAPKAAKASSARALPLPTAGCSSDGCRAAVKVVW